jgi:hypothetical protein
MSNPAIPRQWAAVETTARALGLHAHLLDVRRVDDLRPAFETAVRERAEGLVVGLETLTLANASFIVDLAAKLPARRHLRRQDLQGRQAFGPARRAAHQVRAGHQSANRAGARRDDSEDGHAAGGPGRRVELPGISAMQEAAWPQ